MYVYSIGRARLIMVNVQNYLIHTANTFVCIELVVDLTDITEFCRINTSKYQQEILRRRVAFFAVLIHV